MNTAKANNNTTQKAKTPLEVQALDIQIGGNHYKDFIIQPVEFSTKNKLGFLQGCMIKRICRYNLPNGGGLKDLQKIKHEVDLLVQIEGWEDIPDLNRKIGEYTLGDLKD